MAVPPAHRRHGPGPCASLQMPRPPAHRRHGPGPCARMTRMPDSVSNKILAVGAPRHRDTGIRNGGGDRTRICGGTRSE